MAVGGADRERTIVYPAVRTGLVASLKVFGALSGHALRQRAPVLILSLIGVFILYGVESHTVGAVRALEEAAALQSRRRRSRSTRR